jgi:SAM-dependent methyltransferase
METEPKIADWQLAELEKYARLAEKIGIAPAPDCNNNKLSAETALEKLTQMAVLTSKQCGADIFGPGKHTPAEKQMPEQYLMSSAFSVLSLFVYANSAHSSFLDLGCGSGFPVSLGLKLGFYSCGVDNDLEIVSTAKNNLKNAGQNPELIVHGDYMSDDFWEVPICGKAPFDFDLFYIYNYWKPIRAAIPKTAEHMKKDSYLVLNYWNPFSTEDDDQMLLKKCGLAIEEWKSYCVFLRKK